MRLHPHAPFGVLVAVTIGGVALIDILGKIHNSMKAVPATSSIIKVTPKPVVVTPKPVVVTPKPVKVAKPRKMETDPETGCQRDAPVGGVYVTDENFTTCVWEQRQKQRLNETINGCKAGFYGNLRGEEAVRFCNLHFPSWME